MIQRRSALKHLIGAAAFGLAGPGVMAAGAGAATGAGEVADIERVFERARTALAAGQGGVVVGLLSRPSLGLLEKLRVAAKSGAGSGAGNGMGGFNAAERLAALALGRVVPAAELRRLKLPELADWGLSHGWLPGPAIAGSALGPVRVTGLKASAPLLIDHRPAILGADFAREAAGWRIDLTSAFAAADQLLKGFAMFAGKPEEVYVAGLVARLKPGAPRALPPIPGGQGLGGQGLGGQGMGGGPWSDQAPAK